jgi:hypothetical protein
MLNSQIAFSEVIMLAKYYFENQLVLYRGKDFSLFVRRVGIDFIEITKASENQQLLPLMENDGRRITTFTITPLDLVEYIQNEEDYQNLAISLLMPNEVNIDKTLVDLESIVPFEPSENDSRERRQRSVVYRPGQQEFREKILHIYGSKCLVTDSKIVELLQASHISPYNGDYSNHIQNGLLLRVDIHTLFDNLKLSVCPETWVISLHPHLIDSEYWFLNNKSIIEHLPDDIRLMPSKKALKYHYTEHLKEISG